MLVTGCYTHIGRAVSLVAFAVLTSGLSGAASAEGEAAGGAGSFVAATNDSTIITADELTFDYELQAGFLRGNVHVVNKDLTVDADKMTIGFSEANQVTNIVATGKVSIRQGDRVASCETSTCDIVSGKMTLTGNPSLVRGPELMRGDTIVIVREPAKKTIRIMCYPAAKMILAPGARMDDMRLLNE